jgi:Propanediol utilization protein
MNTVNMTQEQLTELITKIVIKNMDMQKMRIPLGVSNRHIHLDRADMDILFGAGSELTHKKDLGQPGQYASEEIVTLKGPKGQLKNVRVLGPLRSQTQIEISRTDGRTLGVDAPVRESGSLDSTPGIEIIGPAGSVVKDKGVIAALRHIHMTPQEALHAGLADGQRVCVQLGTKEARGAVLQNTVVRVSDRYALEMHIDVDEANALGVSSGDFALVVE